MLMPCSFFLFQGMLTVFSRCKTMSFLPSTHEAFTTIQGHTFEHTCAYNPSFLNGTSMEGEFDIVFRAIGCGYFGKSTSKISQTMAPTIVRVLPMGRSNEGEEKRAHDSETVTENGWEFQFHPSRLY